MGIIGYANNGSQLSVLAEALGMLVVYFDTADRLAMGNARSVRSVGELLEVADLHVAICDRHVPADPSMSATCGTDWILRFTSRARCVLRSADT